jgi:hypothetical protein
MVGRLRNFVAGLLGGSNIAHCAVEFSSEEIDFLFCFII